MIASACHAIRTFDADSGFSLAHFVCSKIVVSAMSRYRKEWNYAFRCSNPRVPRMDHGALNSFDESLFTEERVKKLARLLTGLPEKDRRLIQRLYWDGQTQTDVAVRDGVSPQAVNHQKQKILRALRYRI